VSWPQSSSSRFAQAGVDLPAAAVLTVADQPLPHLRDRLVRELNQMERVDSDLGVRPRIGDCLAEGCGRVDRDHLDPVPPHRGAGTQSAADGGAVTRQSPAPGRSRPFTIVDIHGSTRRHRPYQYRGTSGPSGSGAHPPQPPDVPIINARQQHRGGVHGGLHRPPRHPECAGHLRHGPAGVDHRVRHRCLHPGRAPRPGLAAAK